MFSDSEWDRLVRYLTGECSPAERDEIEAWIDENPRRKARVEELKGLWEASDAAPRSRDVDAAWDALRAQIERDENERERESDADRGSVRSPEEREARPQCRKRQSRWRWVSAGIITATLLFVAVAAFLFAPTHESAPLSEPRVITTEAGEQTRVQLSDSSLVRLNAESQLTVSPSFGDERRVVRLQGEAYFDVKSGAPFIVKARDTRVRVLGTAFGVRSYSSADQVSIVVEEGKVGVDAREDAALERTLGPQQRAVVSSTGGVEVRSNVLLSRYLGWRHGRLVFRSTPLRTVMRSLERQYGLQTFLLDAPLADRELTATFSDEPLSEVLQVIALSLEVGYRHSDSTVVFGRPERNELTSPSAAASPSR